MVRDVVLHLDLLKVGQVALAAERGELAPVPIGLINGNTHRQGTRPPYRPAAIIEAIRQVRRRPKLTAAQINAIIGPPDFITGCTVTGDLAALADGKRTELGLHPRATVTDTEHARGRMTGNRRAFPAVVLDNFPPYINPDELLYGTSDRLASLPIRRMEELTRRGNHRHLYVPTEGTPPETLRDQLLEVSGVSDYVSVGLPMPLAKMVRTWTRTHSRDDLDTSLGALEDR
ncbi:MAG TPA: hypothetical protein VFI65_25680 [Streptosporangiaceae bacterium]|nr:hypothetical protein [Streptosporangiaceae bacterium]